MSARPRRGGGRGRFLSFEGVDGAGKSTQIRLLAAALGAEGHEVVTTREPGGSPGAEEIRRLLVEGEGGRWSAETEILLFTAARRDHLERTILPALTRGALVLSDRFADSTRVYQGLARPDLAAEIERLHAAFIAREPDLTLLIDMDPALALARGRARGGTEQRFEGRGAAFQTALRAGFLALAAAHPGRIRTIDGARPEGAVAGDILALVRPALA